MTTLNSGEEEFIAASKAVLTMTESTNPTVARLTKKFEEYTQLFVSEQIPDVEYRLLVKQLMTLKHLDETAEHLEMSAQVQFAMEQMKFVAEKLAGKL